MQLSEFFNIFDLSVPYMEKVNFYVSCKDYTSAKRELLNYFILRKKNRLSSAEEIKDSDKNFSQAYISRHFILSGPNEADVYLSSIFLPGSSDYTTMDVQPFLKEKLSFMIMSRQKEKEGALFYAPGSIFPPFVLITDLKGQEVKVYPDKYAYISSASPHLALSEEDIYEICEESEDCTAPYGEHTGRVYLSFDFSKLDLSKIASARFHARITLPSSCEKKELLFFNVSDHSWDNTLTWSRVKGNVYSWESSPTGPEWTKPEYSDSEYLNVISRFWFARPMAYQYLSDIEKNSVYGEKLLFLMDAFSQKKEGGFNRVLETGERLSNFACVLNALVDTPAMTPDYLVSILWIMYRDMKSLVNNPDLGWSNWAVVRTSGLSKAVDFLPEFKEHSAWKAHTRRIMNELFDKMYSPDFSFRESGLAYSFWCLDLFASAFHAAELNNDPYSAFMRSRLEKAFDASIDALYPNFYDTNIGDSNYADKTGYLKSMSRLFPTKKLKAFVTGNDDPSVAASCHYPYSGSVIMRNGFNRENAIYIAMHALPFDGHAHSDLGSIVMYAKSRPLITDTGRYGYSESPIAAHLHTPSAHNSIEIEGVEYLPHSKANPKIDSFYSNNAFDFATVSFNPCAKTVHVRKLLFVKNGGYAIVNDYISTHEDVKMNQHWHFMPGSDATVDFNNHVKTAFPDGGNIKILCPDSHIATVEEDIFSQGYGVADNSLKATFTKFASTTTFTTLLLPYADAEPKVSAASLTPVTHCFSSAVFDIGTTRNVFYTKNTSPQNFAFYAFDGDMAYVSGDNIFIADGSLFCANSVSIIESPGFIKDMAVRISGGVVEIESSSLVPSTNRDEAVKIYSPKTTHVLLNGQPVPFTLYSDYVYAVKTK